jgi:hypothetical protein
LFRICAIEVPEPFDSPVMDGGPEAVQVNVALLKLLVRFIPVDSPEQIVDSTGSNVTFPWGFTIIVKTVGGTEVQPTVALNWTSPL